MRQAKTLATRREVLAAGGLTLAAASRGEAFTPRRNAHAQIAITLDLEMSRHYPKRGMQEWDYQKGNLDEATKAYAVQAAEVANAFDVPIHFFLVGRVLEQSNVAWLLKLIKAGHAIGNHTYDHVNVKAKSLDKVQFRFQRAPWLVDGKSPQQVIRDNIRLCRQAMAQRLNHQPDGFRTPGGFTNGLADQPELQRWFQERGLSWVSSKYPSFDAGQTKEGPSENVLRAILAAQTEAQPFRYPSGLIEIPMSPISDVHAFRSLRWSLPQYLRTMEAIVKQTIQRGEVFDFLCHPSCMVIEDPQLLVIKRICQLVRDAAPEAARIVKLDEIARRTANE